MRGAPSAGLGSVHGSAPTLANTGRRTWMGSPLSVQMVKAALCSGWRKVPRVVRRVQRTARNKLRPSSGRIARHPQTQSLRDREDMKAFAAYSQIRQQVPDGIGAKNLTGNWREGRPGSGVPAGHWEKMVWELRSGAGAGTASRPAEVDPFDRPAISRQWQWTRRIFQYLRSSLWARSRALAQRLMTRSFPLGEAPRYRPGSKGAARLDVCPIREIPLLVRSIPCSRQMLLRTPLPRHDS